MPPHTDLTRVTVKSRFDLVDHIRHSSRGRKDSDRASFSSTAWRHIWRVPLMDRVLPADLLQEHLGRSTARCLLNDLRRPRLLGTDVEPSRSSYRPSRSRGTARRRRKRVCRIRRRSAVPRRSTPRSPRSRRAEGGGHAAAFLQKRRRAIPDSRGGSLQAELAGAQVNPGLGRPAVGQILHR